jgi:hypothetical protein
VAGVAQQLAQGLAAAMQNGAPAGPQPIPGAPGMPGAPGIVFHQFAIPLGNVVVGGGPGAAGAAAAAAVAGAGAGAGAAAGAAGGAGVAPVAAPGAADLNGNSDSAAVSLPAGAVEVLEIPPDSEMASYLRVVRGNAPLRAAQLRLCWGMAMSLDIARPRQGRPVLPDDLYVQVAEHLQPARVALMLHRRAHEVTDGVWDHY